MATEISIEQLKELSKGSGIKCSEAIKKLSWFISLEHDMEIEFVRENGEHTILPLTHIDTLICHDLTLGTIRCRVTLKDKFETK